MLFLVVEERNDVCEMRNFIFSNDFSRFRMIFYRSGIIEKIPEQKIAEFSKNSPKIEEFTKTSQNTRWINYFHLKFVSCLEWTSLHMVIDQGYWKAYFSRNEPSNLNTIDVTWIFNMSLFILIEENNKKYVLFVKFWMQIRQTVFGINTSTEQTGEVFVHRSSHIDRISTK